MRIPFIQAKVSLLVDFLPNLDIELYHTLHADQRIKVVRTMDMHFEEQKEFNAKMKVLKTILAEEPPTEAARSRGLVIQHLKT